MLVQQFTARYRRAVVAKAAVFAALTLSVIGVLAWRLLVWQRPGWIVGGCLGLALIVAVGFVWWLRRAWMSPREAVAQLDRTLGLQQRLTTVTEFAHALQAPALYPLLVEETAQRLSTRQVRFPRPLDRTAGVLVAILVLLLCWPGRGGVFSQLTQQPSAVPPVPSPKGEPQNTQQDTQETTQGGGSQSAAGNEQGSQQGEERGDQSQQDSAKGGSAPGGSTSLDSARDRSLDSARDSARDRQPEGRRSEERAPSQRQQAGTVRRDAEEASAARGEREHATSSSPSVRASQDQAGRGGGQGLGNQDAIHAEIQQLLKEVSGELKQLEAQLAAAKEQPQPEPGSSTDPNLYEAPMAPEQPQGVALPIQLTTDTAQTEQQRPGGGVGRPSDRATAATPQVQAEEAQLSEEPLEEISAARQPIPSEYREVFDRLHHQRQQPSEETK